MFELDEEGLENVFQSACNLCHLGSSAGNLKVPKKERTKGAESGRGGLPFIEDIEALSPPEPSLNMGAIGTRFAAK